VYRCALVATIDLQNFHYYNNVECDVIVKLATQIGILSDLDDFLGNKKVEQNEEDNLENWRNIPMYSPTHRLECPGYMGVEV